MSYAILPLSGDCPYIAHPLEGEPFCAASCPSHWIDVGGAEPKLCIESAYKRCAGQYLLVPIDGSTRCADVCPDGWASGEHNGVMECIEQPEWAEPWVGPHDDPDDPPPNGGGGGGSTSDNGAQSSSTTDTQQAAIGVSTSLPWWMFAGAALLLVGSATYYSRG